MINLIEKLKDCPKGTKLYSPLFGECSLYNVNSRIELLDSKNNKVWLYYNGKYCQTYDGECMLFPSKENRDWSKFQRPFKDGDILAYTSSYTTVFIYRNKDNNEPKHTTSFYVGHTIGVGYRDFYIYNKSTLIALNCDCDVRLATEEEKQKLFDAIKANGYRWNAETKTLEKLVKPKFKIGDRVKENKDYISGIVTDIFDDSFKVTYDYGGCSYVQFNYQCYWELVRDVPKFKVGDKICKKSDKHGWVKIATITDTCYIDEHRAFNIPIEKQDEWELYLEKFDITTLKPYDKVLTRRQNNDKWEPQLFSCLNNNSETFHCYKFVLVGSFSMPQCIPYNGNEHLLGTSDDCDDYYKNWSC